jgi:hypothetical protein
MSHFYTHVTHETLGNRLMALLVERQTYATLCRG